VGLETKNVVNASLYKTPKRGKVAHVKPATGAQDACYITAYMVTLNNASDYRATGLLSLGLGLAVRQPDSPMHC